MFKILIICGMFLGGDSAEKVTTGPEWLKSTVHNTIDDIYYDELDINTIKYIKAEDIEEIDLGFDTSKYLPNDFDPYLGTLSDIEYTNENDLKVMDLSFDERGSQLENEK